MISEYFIFPRRWHRCDFHLVALQALGSSWSVRSYINSSILILFISFGWLLLIKHVLSKSFVSIPSSFVSLMEMIGKCINSSPNCYSISTILYPLSLSQYLSNWWVERQKKKPSLSLGLRMFMRNQNWILYVQCTYISNITTIVARVYRILICSVFW